MKELYLFRHGRSEFNEQYPHLIGGRSNHSPLVKAGQDESVKLGLWIAERQLEPDVVYFSPAVRTVQTGEIALATAGITLVPVIDSRIQELSQGPYEGLIREKIFTQELIDRRSKEKLHFKLDGGESMHEVGVRKHDWADDVISKEGHNIVFAFTHGVAIRCYVGKHLGWSFEEIIENQVDNASATIVRYDDVGNIMDIEFNINTQATAT